MNSADLSVILILAAGMLFSIRWKKLTVPAAITGALLGGTIYAGAGLTGLSMLTVFFILGTAATSWKKNEKHPLIDAPSTQPNSTLAHSTSKPIQPTGNAYQPTRHTGQVLANAGIAAITGGLIILLPTARQLLQLMMAASIASAAADTVSSELGMVYGRRFYNILTGRPDQRGLDGVISIEGLLFGLAASAVIAFIYALGIGWNNYFWIILIAGTMGNGIDSLLGATLERRRLINNDTVNFLNTLAAALIAAALACCLARFLA
jgi:uncharacterized protein (TIGR00297 family)